MHNATRNLSQVGSPRSQRLIGQQLINVNTNYAKFTVYLRDKHTTYKRSTWIIKNLHGLPNKVDRRNTANEYAPVEFARFGAVLLAQSS